MVLYFRHLVPKGYRSITLFPFIFLSDKEDKKDRVLLNHEKIHLRQQVEMLVIPFYIWYATEYLIRFVQHRNTQKAYRSISFEKEAYANETQFQYLQKRIFWRFLSYL